MGAGNSDEYLEWLADLGIEAVDVGNTWQTASEYILRHNPALGDSFAPVTAEDLGAALLIGRDSGYDEVSTVPIDRFRGGNA